MQKIKELIKPQLDGLFVDIQKLVKKSQERQPSLPEVLTQDMQQKLDTVPVLSTAVEGLQEKQREYERNFFVIDGASTTLKDRVDTFEKNQLELKTTVSDQNLRLTNVESSVEDVFGAIRSGGGPGTLFP